MKYTLNLVGDFHEATPREMMLQNIQEMVYFPYEEGLTFRQMRERLEQWANERGCWDAVKEFLDYNVEQNAHLLDENESLQVTTGKGVLQFDLRPVRNEETK